jgi:sRNA-binding carbon storage regulator CsrA
MLVLSRKEGERVMIGKSRNKHVVLGAPTAHIKCALRTRH